MKIKIIILSLLTLGINDVLGQKPIFRNYSVNDGLAGSNVYECNQDSKGYLWFATETGVSRFDGLRFESFSIEDGLSDTEVFGTREDSKGRIWFLTYNGKLSYFHDGEIHNSFTDTLLEDLSFNYYIKNIFEDNSGNLWFASHREGIKILTKEGKILKYSSEAGTFNDIIEFYDSDTSLLAFKKYTKLEFKGTSFVKENRWDCEPLFNRWNREPAYLHLFKLCDDGLYLNDHGKKLKMSVPTRFIRDVALSLMEDQQGNLWVGTKGDGLLKITKNDSSFTVRQYLKDATVSHIFMDYEKNIWVCTFEEGVYFLSVNNFLSYTRSDGLSHNFIPYVHQDGDNLILGTSEGNINILNLKTNEVHKQDLLDIENEFNKVISLLTDKYGNIWAATDFGLAILPKGGSLEDIIFKHIGSCKYMTKTHDNDIYVGTSNGAFVAYAGDEESLTQIWGKRTLAIHKDRKNKVWFGALDGLYLFDGDTAIHVEHNHPLLKKRITEIKSLSDNCKVIGTYGYGIVLLSENNEVHNITTRHGLLSNFVRSISIDEDENLWLSTDRGLSMISLTQNHYLENIRNYTDADGLISHDVRSTAIIGDTIFVATSSGLTFFDMKHPQSNYLPPLVHFKGIHINNQNLGPKSEYFLQDNQNTIEIKYTAISFESVGDITFKYKMHNLDNEWTETRNTSLTFPKLRPGEYVFELWAYSKNGLESKRPILVTFKIKPHFTQTVWFKLIVIVSLTMVLFAVIIWRINFIKKQNDVARKMIELEQKALRTQMNPHFIFNTMSSIQQFVNTNDKRAANRYLSKFATLMRGILHNSDKQYVTLQEEFDLMDIYLELEALRMNNKFKYEIYIDPEIDTVFTRIPPMLIQPFVENAILHGLANLEDREGHLQLRIEEEGDYLKCSIEDNGIGRKKAAEIKAKRTIKHESTAMRNVQERIDLLKHGKEDVVNLNVIDLEDSNGNPCGTRVEVIVPYN